VVQLSGMSLYMHNEGGSDAVWDWWWWMKWRCYVGWVYTYISGECAAPNFTVS